MAIIMYIIASVHRVATSALTSVSDAPIVPIDIKASTALLLGMIRPIR